MIRSYACVMCLREQIADKRPEGWGTLTLGEEIRGLGCLDCLNTLREEVAANLRSLSVHPDPLAACPHRIHRVRCVICSEARE